MKNRFGGSWTQQKLAILEAYLNFYVTALKNQRFTLHYADAFAGSGKYQPAMLEEQEELIPLEVFRGSVLTALEVTPGFDHYHFNDLNREFLAELDSIREDHAGKDIQLYNEDANTFVRHFCRKLGKYDRAVLLLDPFSTQLDWETLHHVAGTGRVDLWVLFPISVIARMTPTDNARARPEWKSTLDRLLGTDSWEAALYRPVEPPPIDDLFGSVQSPSLERLNIKELQDWITKRFESVFYFVAPPVPLKDRGRTLFLFYFTVASRSEAAKRLASKAANHIISKNIGSIPP